METNPITQGKAAMAHELLELLTGSTDKINQAFENAGRQTK